MSRGKSIVINVAVLGGIGSIFAGLCLKDMAWALVFIGVVACGVGAAAWYESRAQHK